MREYYYANIIAPSNFSWSILSSSPYRKISIEPLGFRNKKKTKEDLSTNLES